MKKQIAAWLLPKLLAKKSPSSIPRTGEAGKKMNCYSIYLGADDEKPTHLLDGYDQNTQELIGLAPDANGYFRNEVILPIDKVLEEGINVYFYYGLSTQRYTNMYILALYQVIPLDKLVIRLKRCRLAVSQAIFNKKKLITRDSIQLLQTIVDNQLKETSPSTWTNSSSTGVTACSLMTALYSSKWIEHPASGTEKRRLELHLDALTDSGDLTKGSNGLYLATGRALRTIEEHEELERRHGEAVRQQWLMLFLTLVLAIAAAAEAL